MQRWPPLNRQSQAHLECFKPRYHIGIDDMSPHMKTFLFHFHGTSGSVPLWSYNDLGFLSPKSYRGGCFQKKDVPEYIDQQTGLATQL